MPRVWCLGAARRLYTGEEVNSGIERQLGSRGLEETTHQAPKSSAANERPARKSEMAAGEIYAKKHHQ